MSSIGRAVEHELGRYVRVLSADSPDPGEANERMSLRLSELADDLLQHGLAPVQLLAYLAGVGLADLAAQVDETLGEDIPEDLGLARLKRQLHVRSLGS
jgi:hypothetical protein